MIEPKPLLICTVGLPRSGKSSWAKQQGLPVVSRDAVRLALHSQQYLATAEDMVRTITSYVVKALFHGGNQTVILDECNPMKQRRDVWMSDEWSTVFQYFDTPMEECQRRAIATNREDLLPVISRMAQEMDYVPMLEIISFMERCNQNEISYGVHQYIQFLWEFMATEEYQAQDVLINALTGRMSLEDAFGSEPFEYRGVKIKLQEA